MGTGASTEYSNSDIDGGKHSPILKKMNAIDIECSTSNKDKSVAQEQQDDNNHSDHLRPPRTTTRSDGSSDTNISSKSDLSLNRESSRNNSATNSKPKQRRGSLLHRRCSIGHGNESPGSFQRRRTSHGTGARPATDFSVFSVSANCGSTQHNNQKENQTNKTIYSTDNKNHDDKTNTSSSAMVNERRTSLPMQSLGVLEDL